MKTRSGFVSNSSSSSFAVSCDPKMLAGLDIKHGGYKVIKTVKELDAEYEEHHWDKDATKEDYDKAKKALAKGKVVLSGSCDRFGPLAISEVLRGELVACEEN